MKSKRHGAPRNNIASAALIYRVATRRGNYLIAIYKPRAARTFIIHRNLRRRFSESELKSYLRCARDISVAWLGLSSNRTFVLRLNRDTWRRRAKPRVSHVDLSRWTSLLSPHEYHARVIFNRIIAIIVHVRRRVIDIAQGLLYAPLGEESCKQILTSPNARYTHTQAHFA